MAICLIGLGSNLGDRYAHLEAATTHLGYLASTRVIGRSTLRETAPIGGPSAQGAYLNGSLLIETSRSPRELLRAIQEIESNLGRTREEAWQPRTIDLDILLFGDQITADHDLLIPHPWLSVRRFALEPAVEIAAEMIHPLVGRSLGQIWEHLNKTKPITLLVSTKPLAENDEVGQMSFDMECSLIRMESFVPREGLWFERCEWQNRIGESSDTTVVFTAASAPCAEELVAEDSAGRAHRWQIDQLTPFPRIVVGLVNRQARTAPWRRNDGLGIDERIAKSIAASSVPFVLIEHGRYANQQIAAAIAASCRDT